MSVDKHTPAPWRYEPGTKTIRSVPTNYWLASMNSWDGAVNHEANAQLIATAPELLEKAEAALQAINQYQFFLEGYCNGSASISETKAAGTDQDNALKELFETIKKAKGE